MAENKAPEEETTPADGENAAGEGVEGGAPKSKKKLFIIIGAVVVVLLAVVGALFAFGVIGGGKEKAEKEAHAAEAAKKAGGESAFYDAQDMVVNITDASGRQRFLKLSLSLELSSKEDEVALKAIMPRVTDQFQTYLRELKVEDLRGSAGIYRLRQELLSRVRAAAKPVDVRDVLFREILVQ